MRLPSRRPDDADVIRARLRALLAADAAPGWVPDDDPAQHDPGDDADVEPSAGEGRPGPGGLPAGVGRHRAPDRTVRIDPGRPGARALLLVAVAAVLGLVGWTWLQRPSVQPAPRPVESSAVSRSEAPPTTPTVGEVAQTSSTVVVAVVGEVVRPGLVTVPSGARVADALEAAGGLLPDADPASVNLAAFVADGQQIAVGVPGAAAGPQAPGGASGSGGAGGGPVNLNTATPAELDALPRIGPVLAQRIVEHRDRQGPFRSVDQLADVPGIGPAILGGLADAVTV